MRAVGPLARIVKARRELELVLPQRGHVPDSSDLSWDWLSTCDCLFLQRPFSPLHVSLAKMARAMRVGIWMDWDDDILAVRRSNPKFEMYTRSDIKEALRSLPGLADRVTVSTSQLCERIAPLCTTLASCEVLPNAFQWKFTNEYRRKAISWRGSKHHVENFEHVLPQIREIAQNSEFLQWRWHFLGDAPWQAFEAIPTQQLICTPGTNPYEYMERFCQIGSWIHIVPLADNRFNRSKSNVAWLEATAAGAVVIAPDWEEWRKPGIINYRDAADFGEKLKTALRAFLGGPIHPFVQLSREYIKSNLLLENVNERRWELIRECCTVGQTGA